MRPAAPDSQRPAAAVLLLRIAAGQGARSLDGLVESFPASEAWAACGQYDHPAPAVEASLDPAAQDGAASLLSSDEAARAESLRDREVRASFVLGHACLRLLLARELGLAPSMVQMKAGTFGKPRLTPPAPGMHFSFSRRPGYVAIALGTAPLGVDVEVAGRGVDIHGIAARFFTAAEQHYLTQGGPDDASLRFFGLWARKESLLKAAGLGVDYLPMACALKSPAALVNESGAGRSYAVHQLQVPADCALALSMELPALPA